MQTIREVIGSQVSAYRHRRGWSQEDLGQRLEQYTGYAWSRPAMSKAERGGRAFDIDDLLALAGVLGVSILQLLSTDEVEVQLASGATIASHDLTGAFLPRSAETLDAAITTAGARHALEALEAELTAVERTVRRVGERVAEAGQAIGRAKQYRDYLWVPFADPRKVSRRRKTNG